jgi:hypothetical protein
MKTRGKLRPFSFLRQLANIKHTAWMNIGSCGTQLSRDSRGLEGVFQIGYGWHDSNLTYLLNPTKGWYQELYKGILLDYRLSSSDITRSDWVAIRMILWWR